jgi:uncharacterized protein YcbX
MRPADNWRISRSCDFYLLTTIACFHSCILQNFSNENSEVIPVLIFAGMSMKPYLQRISIYPVKSLDGISPETAVISESGCLKWDREFAIFDKEGKYVNGKSHPGIHLLRAEFNLDDHEVVLSGPENKNRSSFHLQEDRKEIDAWLSDFFNQQVSLLQNQEGKFMDDPDLGHVTVAGTASFNSVSSWFSITDPEEVRRRLRVTLEISGLDAFAEDGLFADKGRVVRFKIGDVNMLGMRPRERCVVPTRHPETAAGNPCVSENIC